MHDTPNLLSLASPLPWASLLITLAFHCVRGQILRLNTRPFLCSQRLFLMVATVVTIAPPLPSIRKTWILGGIFCCGFWGVFFCAGSAKSQVGIQRIKSLCRSSICQVNRFEVISPRFQPGKGYHGVHRTTVNKSPCLDLGSNPAFAFWLETELACHGQDGSPELVRQHHGVAGHLTQSLAIR